MMLRKALHVSWIAEKEMFAMTLHVHPLFRLARRTLQ